MKGHALFKKLVSVANSLDAKGLLIEADELFKIITRLADLETQQVLTDQDKWRLVTEALVSLGFAKSPGRTSGFGERSFGVDPILNENTNLANILTSKGEAFLDVGLQIIHHDDTSAVSNDTGTDTILFLNFILGGSLIATQAVKLSHQDFNRIPDLLKSNKTIAVLSQHVAEKLKAKERLVATNVATEDELSEGLQSFFAKNKGSLTSNDADARINSYHNVLYAMYKEDVVSKKAHQLRMEAVKNWQQAKLETDAAKKKLLYEKVVSLTQESYQQEQSDKHLVSSKSAEKQITNHTFFTDLIDLQPGAKVISPGAGLAHETIISRQQYNWVAMDYQESLINMGKQRDNILGKKNNQYVQWSVWNGNLAEAQKPINQKVLDSKLGDIPDGDAIYCKHACGGITDGSLKKAVENGISKVVIASCCADRFPGISHAVLCPEKPFEEYMAIVKRSMSRSSADGQKAVEEIDSLREIYLKNKGYEVERGWKVDEHGNRLPAGSYLIATKKRE